MTALKAKKLAEEHNFNIHDTEGFDPCESDRNSCPNNTPLFAFQPITTGDVHKIIKTLFTWSGGPRSSGVSFFCFVSSRA